MSDTIAPETIPVTDGALDALPADVGYDARYLDNLDRHFRRLIQRKELQSAGYLLLRGGKVFAHRSHGFLRWDGPAPFLPDSIHYIASITKFFTSVAILSLYERGIVDIHESISRWLSEADTKMHKGITIHHLLTHTSGITADGGYFQEPYQAPWFSNGDKDWIKAILQGPLQAEPGEEWNYCSRGFMLLGEILARASGMRNAEEAIARIITEPLGLKDTTFRPARELWPRISAMSKEHLDDFETDFAPWKEGSIPRTAGGLQSTMVDLGRFGQCLLNKGELGGTRILGPKTVEALRRNQLSGLPAFYWGVRYRNYPYGLGVQLGKQEFISKGTYAHEGYGSSSLYIDPEQDFVAVFFGPATSGWTAAAVDNPLAIIWAGLQSRGFVSRSRA